MEMRSSLRCLRPDRSKRLKRHFNQRIGSLEKYLLLLVYTIFTSATSATAGIVPAFRLRQMTDGADVIAVGRVVAVEERGAAIAHTSSGEFAARAMVATLEIERLLKGGGTGARVDFTFLLPEEMVGYWPIGQGQFGVFFLQQLGPGYQIFDPYHPFVEAVPGTPPMNGSAFEKVIGEMTGVLTSSRASDDARILTVHALDQTPGAPSTAALVEGARQQNEEVRLRSMAALFRRNNLAFLDEATGLLLHPPSGVNPDLLDDMSLGIGAGVTSAKATPSLVKLLKAPRVETRRSAALASRLIGGGDAVRALAGALSDSDRRVQYEAISAVASFTGQNEWNPDLRDYMNKSTEPYLTHWRQWAESNQQLPPLAPR